MCKVGRFNANGVAGVGDAGEWGHGGTDGGESIPDGVAQPFFAVVFAGVEVVAIGVQGGAAAAWLVSELFGKAWEAEGSLKGVAVDTIRDSVG